MGNMLDKGAAALSDLRHDHMTTGVRYVRGDQILDMKATIGRSQFEQVDDNGFVQRIDARDFLVRTDDLLFGEPATGDRIIVASNSSSDEFEVLSIAGQPPFRYSDPFRRTLRIHTKHVGFDSL